MVVSLGLSMTTPAASAGCAHGCRAPISTPAHTVDRAQIIVLGRMNGPDEILVDRVLKGDVPGDRLRVINPAESNFIGFDYPALLDRIGGDSTLLLATSDSSGAAILQWQRGSFWPQGFAHPSIESETLEASTAYVDRLLQLTRLANSIGSLLPELRADLRGESPHGPHAAIGYLEVGLARDLAEPLPERVYGVAALDARDNPNLDGAAMEALAQIAPNLPVSLAGPMFLDMAERAPEDREQSLKNAIWPMLSARDVDGVGPQTSVASLRAALDPMLPMLRRADAMKILKSYGTGVPMLDEGLTDQLLHEIIGQAPDEPLAGRPLAEREALWRQEVGKIQP